MPGHWHSLIDPPHRRAYKIRWLLLALALLMPLPAVAACHSGSDAATSAPGAPAANGENGGGSATGAGGAGGAPGANGAPVANGRGGGAAAGGPGAPGAPIKIPDVEQSQGVAVEDVLNSIENGTALPGESNTYKGIIAQCGGRLCVNVTVKQGSPGSGADGFTRCQFYATDPGPGALVTSGDTIWVLTGTQPCTSSPANQPSSPGTSGDQSSPGGQPSSPGSGGEQSPSETPSP